MTKLKALRAKIGLPIIMAILLTLATVGVVAASVFINRTVTLHAIDPTSTSFSVDPQQADLVDLQIVRGASVTQDFTITNTGTTEITVNVSCATPPEGITIDFSKPSVSLPDHGNYDVVTATFTASTTAPDTTCPIISFTLA